ncbi:MAG TPA: hypothetical protein VGN00_19655 [Puia sp.]|jgi:hypothetical protein
MQTIYKILFEVRLLHEFYLTNPDGSSIFGAPSATARDSFLQDFSERAQRSINSDIDYVVPFVSQQLFKNYRLKLIRTYSGFKIATEVRQTTDSGKIAYAPVASPPPGLAIPILLTRTNSDFDSYTNRRMRPAFDSIYYCSNGAATGVKAFPFLTNPIPAQSATVSYEQGELSQSAGVVSAFYIDGGGVMKFAAVVGKNFLNEGDRILVSPSFQYYFTPADNVKNAVVTLTDKSNQTIYTNTVTSTNPIRAVRLRVPESKLNTLPAGVTEDALVYNLTITGDGGYNKSYKLIFLQSALAVTNAWGMINIINQPGSANYNLIDNKGLLISRYNTDRTVAIAPPVFEIWIKSRFSFWRYINDQGKLLKDSYPAVLKLTGNNLVSLAPQSHSYAPIPVQTQKLPNPKIFNPVKPEGQQIFADIIVPASDVFPLGP